MAGDSFEAQWPPDTQFQLRVRSGDRLRSSPVFTEDDYLEQSWIVSEQGETLGVDIVDAWNREGAPAVHWGLGFLLTLAIEFLVLSLALRVMKQDRADWLRTYVSFGLIHGVTYPLVWTLPIGLLPFQSRIYRLIGLGELLVVLIYLGFLYWLRQAKSWKLIVGSALLLFACHSAVLFTSFVFSLWSAPPLSIRSQLWFSARRN